MKKLLFLLLLLPILAGAQASKDSLLHRDKDIVRNQLFLMHYLYQYKQKGYCMTYMDRLKADRVFKKFYADTLVADNPIPSINIETHLKGKPTNWQELCEAINKANYLLAKHILDTYGYVGEIRPGKEYSSFIEHFVDVPYEKRKPIGKILKKEYALGHMTDKEYELYSFFMSKDSSDPKALKKMAAKGYIRLPESWTTSPAPRP